MSNEADITVFLNQAELDDQTWEKVLPIVYHQLKHLARQVKSDHRATPTLNTTALVHDAYLKIKKHGALNLSGRQHFYRLAAKAMRQLLIDAARAKKSGKRDGQALVWEEHLLVQLSEDEHCNSDQLLAIDHALEQVKKIDPQLVHMVELHFFAGHNFAQIAEIQGVSESTVFRQWKKARAVLYAHLK